MSKPQKQYLLSLCFILLIQLISSAQSPATKSPPEKSPWLFPLPGDTCTYEHETGMCMYELGKESRVRAGFKKYGELQVARLIMERKAYDEMNKKLIANGIEPQPEHINMWLAVARILGMPAKPKKFELPPIKTEAGNTISRFNTESGKVACAVRMTYPKLDSQNFIYSIWLCEPSELKGLQ